MKTVRTGPLLAVAAFLLAHPICACADDGVPAKKVNAVKAVKEAVIAAAGIKALHRDLLNDAKSVERISTIMWTVWILDESRDPEANDALVSLLSYNLGAAANENVSCILVDRGTAVRSKLAALLAAKTTECRTRLKDFPASALQAACVPDDSLKATVSGLIAAIDRKEPCPLR